MRFLLICFGLVLMGSQQVKASGFAIFETSVRVSGMMGAYVADGRDVSTIFFNPAGLAQLSGFHFSGGAEIIAPTSSYRGPYPNSVAKTDMESQQFVIPHVYASYQVMKDLTVGLGLYVPFGLGTKWDRNWVGRGNSTETSIETAVIAPAFGYTLPFKEYGDISIGASLQIGVLGKAILERVVTDIAEPTDGSKRLFRLEGESEEIFYGYTFGMIYKPMDKVSVGFNYRSEMEIKLSGEAQFTNLPSSQFVSGTTGGLTLTTPASLTIGVSVRPIENLTLNLDYVNWGWTSYDSLKIVFSQETARLKNISSPRLFKDVFQLRFGAEYIVNQVQGLTVRAGLGFDQNPVPDETLDSTLPDTDRLLGSLGASYAITKTVGFSVYYTFIRGAERLVKTNELPGYYNTHANLFGAEISIAF